MRIDIKRDMIWQKEMVDRERAIWDNYTPTTTIDYHDIDIQAIGSGSSGNCFILHNKNTDVTWVNDIGVPFNLLISNIAPDNIDRVFITHAHNDHTHGLPNAEALLDPSIIETPKWPYKNSHPVLHIGTDFKPLDNLGYVFNKVLYVTDTGYLSDSFIDWTVENIKQGKVHQLLIEGNYCKHYLWESASANIPRTSHDGGHMSWSELFYSFKRINDKLMTLGLPIIHKDMIKYTTMHLTTGARKGYNNNYGHDCPFRPGNFNKLDLQYLDWAKKEQGNNG